MKESFPLVLLLALTLKLHAEARITGNSDEKGEIGEIFEHSTQKNGLESSDLNKDSLENPSDTSSVFTVSTKVELGSPLMVATPFGCALLAQPNEEQGPIENDPLPNVKGEWLSFDFTLSDLSDCGEMTDAILAQLRHQLLSEYPISTTESPISPHGNGANSDTYDNATGEVSERDIEFREKLNVTMHRTTLDSVFVLRFSLSDEPHPLAQSNIVKALSAVSDGTLAESSINNEAAPEGDGDGVSKRGNVGDVDINKEMDLSKKILEELSSSKSESVECMNLGANEKDCTAYSKCDVLQLDGKKVCFVSPRTAFWLLDTQCALQSKSALLAVAKDLASAGMLTEENYQTLRGSFDVNHICNTITHTYFANSKRLSPVVPPKAFEL